MCMYPTVYIRNPLFSCITHCARAYPTVRLRTLLYVCIPHCVRAYSTVCLYTSLCVPVCFDYPNCHLFTACIISVLQASSASSDTWTRGLMRRLESMTGESQSCTPILRPSSCSIDSEHQAMSFTYTRAIVHSCSLSVG